MGKMRILVVDDQTLMRDGLKTILDMEEDMEVVGTAGNGQEAYDLTVALSPDLVLMDVRMPLMNGVESMKRIKRNFPETNVLILTTFDEDDYILEALANGANGFLLKDMSSDKLIEAVRDGGKGQTMLPSSVAAKLVARLSSSSIPTSKSVCSANEMKLYSHFTEREKEVISYMILNYSNKEIAVKVGITEGTLKNYITVIYEKIGTNERLKAVSCLKEIFRIDKDGS